MIRRFRARALLAGLALTLGVSALGGSLFNGAQAIASYGPDHVARSAAVADALDAYTEAAKTCDIETGRQAWRDAQRIIFSVWTDHYLLAMREFIHFYGVYTAQVPATLGFDGEDAGDWTCEERVQFAEEMEVAWDAVADYLANSPEPNQYYNDLVTLSTIITTTDWATFALTGDPDATPQTPATAPDPAAAKQYWLEFVADYPIARELIAFRNPALATELDGLVAAASAAFEGDPATGYPGAAEAIGAMAGRYYVGVGMVDGVAQNYRPTRPTFDPAHWDQLDTVDDILLTVFEIRDLIALGTPEAAAQIVTEFEEWLEAPLEVKIGWGVFTQANEAMRAAVDAYAAEQSEENKQALLDQILFVEQIYVGQYWGTPELVQYYIDNEGPGGGLPLPFLNAPAAPAA